MVAGTAVRGRHLPGLDGLRALAVGGVVAYHLHLGWAAGGYLGVNLFFVLSGFLITTLLLEERVARSAIALGAFWVRRARRLLPALLLLLVVVSVAGAAGWLVVGTDLKALRGDALATLAYGANWHQIAAGHPYFAQFQAPSPLQHTWSLAIEEQFYLVWPPVLALVLWWSARRARDGDETPWRRPLLVGILAAALASATWMGWLAAHGAGVERLYYGTDTRAFDLLAGCALAAWVASKPEPAAHVRRRLHVGALLGAAVLAGLWGTGGGAAVGAEPPRLMFEGGFALAAVAGVVVLADARLEQPGLLGRLLRVAPLRYVGRISYGIYLWHWPIVTELTAQRLRIHGAALDVALVAITLAVSAASFHFVEQPIRRASLRGWPNLARIGLAPGAMAATAVIIVAAAAPTVAQAAVGPAGAAVAADAPMGSGGLAGQVPVTLLDKRVPSAADPLRVALVGDSVMQTEAPAIEAALEATGAAVVTDWSFPGWGLSTDVNWQQAVPRQLAKARPDLVVAMWSWDDSWLLSNPTGYRAVLDRYVRLLLHPGGSAPGVSGVLFEQYPPLVDASYAADGPAAEARRVAGAIAWSSMMATMPHSFPGRVQYLPLAPAVEQAGRFAAWLPPPGQPGAPTTSWDRVRMVDNTHFCPSGAARYAAALVDDLETLVHLPAPTPSWWEGSWATSPRYTPVAGACPADHPS